MYIKDEEAALHGIENRKKDLKADEKKAKEVIKKITVEEVKVAKEEGQAMEKQGVMHLAQRRLRPVSSFDGWR